MSTKNGDALPPRWGAERTFSCCGRYWRPAKDFKSLMESAVRSAAIEGRAGTR